MDQRKNTENGFNTVEEALEDLRPDLYANVRSLCGKIAASSDGHKEYR